MKKPLSNIKKLISPYSLSHPDSRCVSNGGKRHKFQIAKRRTLRRGIIRETQFCIHCNAQFISDLDYNILAGVFSLPAR